MILKRSHWTPVDLHNLNLNDRRQEASVVLHTNGGHAIAAHGSLFRFYQGRALAGSDDLAHVQVGWDGWAEQYVDGRYKIGHAWDANAFAWGIETEDDNDPSRPWTDAQLNTIVSICREIGVPARELAEAGGGGVGWHQKYGSWNQSGHDCPGSVRVAQIRDVVIPRLRDTHAQGGGGVAGITFESMDDFEQAVRRALTGVKSDKQGLGPGQIRTAFDVALGIADVYSPLAGGDDRAAGKLFAQDLRKAAGA